LVLRITTDSTTGTISYTPQNTGGPSLAAVTAIDANTGWIVGDNGQILKTYTGGANN
jgi:photosystem II stability/assembly factor-like uncharacterized protein